MAPRRWWGTKGSGRPRELEEKAEDVLEGLDNYDLCKRPEVRIINRFVRIRTCIMMVFKAVGSLALLWLTVVLLGGFISSLDELDFGFLTCIGFVQAAGLFNALADEQFILVLSLLLSPFAKLVSLLEELEKYMLSRLLETPEEDELSMSKAFHQRYLMKTFYRISLGIMQIVIWILLLPVLFLSYVGPFTCFFLSSYRLDYGIKEEKDDKANLQASLILFYYLALAQSALYVFWLTAEGILPNLTLHLCNRYGYEREALDDYITETKRKCIQDMALADDWNLITYALVLLDSESPDPDDYCSGLRILHALIEEKVPVSQLLIRSSRERIQKLIGTLGWRRPADWETRELAARVLAHLASDLNLADFPGALEFISSLLDTHCYQKDQESLHFLPRKNRRMNRKKSVLEIMILKMMGPKPNQYMLSDDKQGIKTKQGTKEELILQCLRIVENLANSEHNCIEIYKNKDLLLKITAPLISDKLIEELETNGGCSVRVIDGTLKVVNRLICFHGDIGKNMRHDIAGDNNAGRKDVGSSKENMTAAVSNLVAILGLKGNSNIVGLQTRAVGILAQLFLDESTNLDRGEKKKFIERLLHFFFSEEWMSEYLQEKRTEIIKEATTSEVDNNVGIWLSPLLIVLISLLLKHRNEKHKEELENKKMEEAMEIASQLKVKAGEALSLLSMGSQSNSDVIMNFTGSGDANQCLPEMLDSKITTIKCKASGDEVLDVLIKIGCRISAAEILKHLCAHSTGDHSFYKTVLRKVLEELLHINTTGTNVINGSTSASRTNDVENPRPPSSRQVQPQIQVPGSCKQQSDRRRFQAALLSLYAEIRATWTNTGEFASLLVELVASNDFAGKIKAIIKENSYATPACLAMLKIICEMVIILVQHGHYIQELRDKKIMDALSEASKTMVSLEGCMLFAGMDADCYGVPLKPVSSVLVEKAQELLKEEEPELTNNFIPATTPNGNYLGGQRYTWRRI